MKPTLTVYGHPFSINTRKVLAALAEKGHAATLAFVDVPRGQQRGAAHVALHPFGKLPVVDHGGFVVYETAAILQYLDEVLPGPALWPNEPAARARARQWERVLQSYFEPHAHPAIVHRMFARIVGFPPDAAVITAGLAGMQPALDVVDRHLRGAAYLTGASFGLADLTWMPYVDYLVAIGERDAVLAGRPGLEAWWDRVRTRPSWVAVAHTGLQPYHEAASADAIIAQSRGTWTGTPS